MNNPGLHYIYRSSNASAMAKYVDFGFSIGSGGSFSLVNYYRLCEELVAALKQHPSLLEKHFSRITEDLYYDILKIQNFLQMHDNSISCWFPLENHVVPL